MDAQLTVLSVSEAREELSRTLARFRREGAAAEPVFLGSHRRPEAVVIPYTAYADLVVRRRRRRRVPGPGSVLAQVLGPVSPAISDDELYARHLARQRRRPRG